MRFMVIFSHLDGIFNVALLLSLIVHIMNVFFSLGLERVIVKIVIVINLATFYLLPQIPSVKRYLKFIFHSGAPVVVK